MIAEVLLMAATVWYVPGWMRTEVPQEGVMPAMSNAFLKAEKSVQGAARGQGGVVVRGRLGGQEGVAAGREGMR